jgi:hypothetical protein
MPDKKPIIFLSYARKDEPNKPTRGEVQWRTYVQSYLAPAGLNGIIHIWADEGIRGGDKWKEEIEAQLNTCDLFILLVSTTRWPPTLWSILKLTQSKLGRPRARAFIFFPLCLSHFGGADLTHQRGDGFE